MCARPPFRANNHVELLRKIEERKDQVRFPEGLVSSRAMKTLIRALLKRKPTERMSYEHFFSDPVIRDEIPDMVDEDLPGSMQASERMQTSVLEPPIEPPRRLQKAPVEMDPRAADNPYSPLPRDRTIAPGTTPPSRPSSRPVSGNFSSTPPQHLSARRANNAPADPSDERTSTREHRRPTLTNAATAPGRTATLQDQTAAPTTIGHRRKYSRDEQASTPTGLKEHFDRERIPQRAEANVLKEAAERAAQDNALDEGFVFVEKRRVEIDALADEIANSPQTQRDEATFDNTRVPNIDHWRSPFQGHPDPTKANHYPPTHGFIQSETVSSKFRNRYFCLVQGYEHGQHSRAWSITTRHEGRISPTGLFCISCVSNCAKQYVAGRRWRQSGGQGRRH